MDLNYNNIKKEQLKLDYIYKKIDQQRQKIRINQKKILTENVENPQEISERESYNKQYTDELKKLSSAESNLYFGKIDTQDDEIRIGKIGILDDDFEITSLLVDWRAPIARPFYLATPANPGNVKSKSFITTKQRKITNIHVNDYVSEINKDDNNITDESYLISILNKSKDNKMHEIVSTIQTEQDEIIRSNKRGVTIVQGGPGTGKTAVALHKVAYILYTFREQLTRSGVLMIGPNTDFLKYIDQVLPELGETGIILKTIGEMYPGVTTYINDSEDNAILKGDLSIIEIIKSALYKSVNTKKIAKKIVIDSIEIILDNRMIKFSLPNLKNPKISFKQNKKRFVKNLSKEILKKYKILNDEISKNNKSLLSQLDEEEVLENIKTNDLFNQIIDDIWPEYTPISFLKFLYSNKFLLLDLERKFNKKISNFYQENDFLLTISDIPILDALADILETTEIKQSDEKESKKWKNAISEAQRTLDYLSSSAPQDLEDELDPETLMAYDLLTAEDLAKRQQIKNFETTVDKANNDREWVFGHVVVDEAQELSAMDWNMIFKKIPSKWMTIVGDVNQTSSDSGTKSWNQTMFPYVKNRFTYLELTINYRTPKEIMLSLEPTIKKLNTETYIPKSIRSNEQIPEEIYSNDPLSDLIRILSDINSKKLNNRSIAIISSKNNVEILKEKYPTKKELFYDINFTKGLEFDYVLLFKPLDIVNYHKNGINDLFVAATRTTQKLFLFTDLDLNNYFINTKKFKIEDYKITFLSSV